MTDRDFHNTLREKVERDAVMLSNCGVQLTDPHVLDFLLEFIKAAVREHFGRFTPQLYRATLRNIFPALKKKMA